MIVMFMDHLVSEICILPTTTTLNAENLAKLFFGSWYRENGLPLNIVSDHDKIFLSHFWKKLHKLTSIKLKMSSVYYPETNGASKHTNKTIIQSIQYAVEHNQKDWVQTLPKIHFNIMNTVNSSTGLTPFQLCFGKSPRLIPPLTLSSKVQEPVQITVQEMLACMTMLKMDAHDSLMNAKISQASYANACCNMSFPFAVSDHVLLSTPHQRQEYKAGDAHRVAKFMPCFNGPYHVTVLPLMNYIPQWGLTYLTILTCSWCSMHWKSDPSQRTMTNNSQHEHWLLPTQS